MKGGDGGKERKGKVKGERQGREGGRKKGKLEKGEGGGSEGGGGCIEDKG